MSEKLLPSQHNKTFFYQKKNNQEKVCFLLVCHDKTLQTLS